jgi:hypothetical protein
MMFRFFYFMLASTSLCLTLFLCQPSYVITYLEIGCSKILFLECLNI